MAANDQAKLAKPFSTFWLLYGQHGATMTMEALRLQFFPSLSHKTMINKAAAGHLPKRTGDVFDVRDVADWWDQQRKA